ncbi:MAG TPA: hypothetical protein VI140_12510 [Oxalicibacterium sp.]
MSARVTFTAVPVISFGQGWRIHRLEDAGMVRTSRFVLVMRRLGMTHASNVMSRASYLEYRLFFI